MADNLSLDNIQKLYQRLSSCDICPRKCHVNRLNQEKGFCKMGDKLVVYTAFLHGGEEPAISTLGGSGTVFFSGCNLKCIFCQNHAFSHQKQGQPITEQELATIFINLQKSEAANINLVTPGHFLPLIAQAVRLAKKKGLHIPVVYNTSGYEDHQVIQEIYGLVDVYLADLKYMSKDLSQRYSNAENYPEFNQLSLKEMYKQRPDCIFENDTLTKGLVIRHLVLPGLVNEAEKALAWIKKNTPKAKVSIMFQYQPYHKAENFPEINRRVSLEESLIVRALVEDLGLDGWIQDYGPNETLAGIHFKSDLKPYL